MKKKLVLLLAAAMAVGSLAGCGDSGSGSGDGGAGTADGGTVTDEEVDPRFKYDEPVTLTSYFEISPAISADWNQENWIEKLNLEMPKTMDELYDVMVAFRDQDPDGNGQDDTIGMVFHNNFLSAGLGDAVGLFNGFGAYPAIWVKDGEDKLKYGSIMEENKAALEYIAKMYQEGLIDQDFSSNDEVKASEAAASGRAGIQYGLMWNANWPLNATVQNDPEADWVDTAPALRHRL